MIGRHRKKKPDPAPVLSVVLASVFAGAVAMAPMDGGSGEAEGSSDSARVVANRSDQSSEGKPEQKSERPSKPAGPPSEPPADCDPSDAGNTRHANGRIPDDELCPLPQDGESLRADAAAAFYKLNVAYHKRFGKQICVRSSYRTYAKQKQLYQRMPAGMAARPGNSKHGNGIAVDLCGGVQNGGSPQFKWLENNSKKYGWIHPAWAYSSPYEPWHWEYVG